MPAQPIEWHEECLQNLAWSEREAYYDFARSQDRWRRIEADMIRLERQIARAKRLGKHKFDSERFRDTD